MDRELDWNDPEYVKEIQRLNALARREDLTEVMGFVLALPSHGRDANNEVRWGLRNHGGMADQHFIELFESDVLQILTDVRELRRSPELEIPPAKSQPYSTGPAAQEWSTLLFELADKVMPVLEDGSTLIGWALYLRTVIKRLKVWESERNKEVYGRTGLEPAERSSIEPVSLVPVFTVPALSALCYDHCVSGYGIGRKLVVAIYPRSGFAGFTSAGHPTAMESFVVQLRDGKRQFFYIVGATGEVKEHFLVTGKDVTLLPIPSFDGTSTESRRPEDRIEIEVTTVRRSHQDSFRE